MTDIDRAGHIIRTPADLDVPDIDEQLDVPDYDAPTTPTYRQENTNA